MKRKNQLFNRISLLLLSLAVFVWGVSDTVLALDLDYGFDFVDPYRVYAGDYVSGVVVSGNVKTVTYCFEDVPCMVNIWGSPSGGKVSSIARSTGFTFSPPLSDSSLATDTSFSSRVYIFGSEAFDGKSAPVGCLDISDIMPGANLDLTLGYDLTFSYYEGAVSTAQVVMTAGVMCYDSSGAYLNTYYFSDVKKTITFNSADIDTSTTVSYDPDCVLSIGSDTALILPFTSYNFSVLDGKNLSACQVGYNPLPFELSVDVNMVYEQSQTMEAIEAELGDISQGIQDNNDKLDDVSQGIQDTNDKLDDVSQGIQDTNDKLDDVSQGIQDTNDKMDDVINGTPQQNATADEVGQEMDDTVSEAEDVQAAVDAMDKPEPENIKPNVSSVVSSSSVNNLTAVITPWFENDVFIIYLVVASSLMFCSYVLFGKKV